MIIYQIIRAITGMGRKNTGFGLYRVKDPGLNNTDSPFSSPGRLMSPDFSSDIACYVTAINAAFLASLVPMSFLTVRTTVYCPGMVYV